jgi:hypothetical protein
MMSLFVLDDQLSEPKVLRPILEWSTAQYVHALRPDERILDDRVPEILRTLKQPTFLTIDRGFWDRRFCHPGYCILYFALRDEQQEHLPELLRALLRKPEFRSRARRMGRVARVSTAIIESWVFQEFRLQHIPWTTPRRKK